MSNKKATPAKKDETKISIKGSFVLATFLRECRALGIMEADALILFVTLQKQGQIIDAGGIGFSGQIKSFTYKNSTTE